MSSKASKGPRIVVVCHNETQVNEGGARSLGSEHGRAPEHGRPTGEHETMRGKTLTWDAAVGARLYVATSTASGAMQITLNDVPVWSGRRLGVGKYEEEENAIPPHELSKVLEFLRDGDVRRGGEHARALAPSSAPAAAPARPPTKAKAPTHKAPTKKAPTSAKREKGTWHVHVSLKGMEDKPITTYPFDTEGEARAFATTKRDELAQHPGSLVVSVKGGKAEKKPRRPRRRRRRPRRRSR